MNGERSSLRPPGSALLPVTTLVLWSLTLGAGLVGLAVPYGRPVPPKTKEIPIVAETVQVELTSEPLPNVSPELPPAAESPPLDAPIVRPEDAPALTPVADPSVVAFALPVEGPVRIVEARKAAYVAPAAPVTPAPAAARPASAPQQLVYGQGEGRQPAPEYPYRARRDGQEGAVKVRFTVGENGLVLAAEAAQACPWALLNDAAVRAVRERWRFRAGPLRVYEVTIRFQLQR